MDVRAAPGSTVNVDVIVQPRSPGIAGIQFDLEYPASVATLAVADPARPVEITFPYPVLEGATTSINATHPGLVKVAAASTRNSTRGGTFLRVPLRIKEGVAAGRYPLRLLNARVFDQNRRPLNVRVELGTLTVGPPATCGDVDLSGGIDVIDAQMALQAIVDLVTLTPAQKEAADTDSDGVVTTGDVVKILRIIVGLDGPCGPADRPIPLG